MDILDLTPVSTEQISPADFARCFERDRKNIKNVRIVPPSFGDLDDADFGSLCVEYKSPIYKVLSR